MTSVYRFAENRTSEFVDYVFCLRFVFLTDTVNSNIMLAKNYTMTREQYATISKRLPQIVQGTNEP